MRRTTRLASGWTLARFQSGLDFIYPKSCHWCHELLPEQASQTERFCQRCRQDLAPHFPHRCQRCSAPVGPYLDTSNGCIHCQREKGRFSTIASLGPYQNALRLACLKGKQRGQTSLANALTELLCQQHAEQIRSWGADLVVPVPHHWRDRLRSDHASVAVAESLGRFLKVPVARHILRKVRKTRKQQKLPASARKDNLKAAFQVARSVRLEGKTILLADDILTTGITADRCASVLLNAGAARVDVAVLARAIGG